MIFFNIDIDDRKAYGLYNIKNQSYIINLEKKIELQ